MSDPTLEQLLDQIQEKLNRLVHKIDELESDLQPVLDDWYALNQSRDGKPTTSYQL